MSESVRGSISREEVAHLARLARLAVTPAELDTFAAQLDVILGAVARVGEVAAEDIAPTSHAVPLSNVFRPDELRPGLTQDQALSGAPAAEDGRFRVPRILDEEPLAGSSVSAEEPLAGSSVSAEEPLAGSSVSAEEPLAGSSVSAEEPLAGSSVSAEEPLAGSSVSADEPHAGSGVSGEEQWTI